MTTKIKFLSILADNPGITKNKMKERLDLSRSHFNNITRHMISCGLIRIISEPNFIKIGSNRSKEFPQILENPSLVIKRKGRSVLRNEYEARIPSQRRMTKPDYPRIRKILNAPVWASNAEVADLWNELTDFYLPYGNEELRPIY